MALAAAINATCVKNILRCFIKAPQPPPGATVIVVEPRPKNVSSRPHLIKIDHPAAVLRPKRLIEKENPPEEVNREGETV